MMSAEPFPLLFCSARPAVQEYVVKSKDLQRTAVGKVSMDEGLQDQRKQYCLGFGCRICFATAVAEACAGLELLHRSMQQARKQKFTVSSSETAATVSGGLVGFAFPNRSACFLVVLPTEAMTASRMQITSLSRSSFL